MTGYDSQQLTQTPIRVGTQQEAAPQIPTGPRAQMASEAKARGAIDGDRRAPSKASGGVPNPTQQYMLQSHFDPVVLPEPRRILVIMDLNGTLLYRPNKRRPFNFIERPHAKAFVKYCLDTFYVAIWSSARPENVEKMVSQLLTPKQRRKCILIWARDRFGLTPSDYNLRIQVYKRLTSIWADPRVMASHPDAATGGHWNQTNTVLLDDSIEKGRSEPFNLLEIPEFSGLATEPPDVLPQVHNYLNALSYQSDISRLMRKSPFKLDPGFELSSKTRPHTGQAVP